MYYTKKEGFMQPLLNNYNAAIASNNILSFAPDPTSGDLAAFAAAIITSTLESPPPPSAGTGFHRRNS